MPGHPILGLRDTTRSPRSVPEHFSICWVASDTRNPGTAQDAAPLRGATAVGTGGARLLSRRREAPMERGAPRSAAATLAATLAAAPAAASAGTAAAGLRASGALRRRRAPHCPQPEPQLRGSRNRGIAGRPSPDDGHRQEAT
eukprot:gene8949-biopygen4623